MSNNLKMQLPTIPTRPPGLPLGSNTKKNPGNSRKKNTKNPTYPSFIYN